MKEKFFCYTVETDVSEIECDLYDATVIIDVSADKKLRAEFPCAGNIHAGNADSTLYINQEKKPLFRNSGQIIKIFVPEHIVPALTLSGGGYGVEINGGIFKEVEISAEDAGVSIKNCSCESVEIMCEKTEAHFADLTVRNNLFVQTKEGDVLAENTFAPFCELHVRCGNIGLSALNCKEASLDAGTGNITATVAGSESDYTLSVMAKEGTANLETSPEPCGEKTIKAYSEKGNIAIDFLEKNPRENI